MRGRFAVADELPSEKEAAGTACERILASRWATPGCNQLALLAEGDSTVMRSSALARVLHASWYDLGTSGTRCAILVAR